MQSLPLWVRKFFVDAIETGIAAIFAVQFVLPQDEDEAVRVLAILAAAIGSALVSAARRAIPGFLEWLNAKLGTSEVRL